MCLGGFVQDGLPIRFWKARWSFFLKILEHKRQLFIYQPGTEAAVTYLTEQRELYAQGRWLCSTSLGTGNRIKQSNP